MIEANRIFKGLWQGSFPPPGGYVAAARFQTLVLCAEELQLPAGNYPGTRVVYGPNRDDGSPLTDEQFQVALRTANTVSGHVRVGRRVLVTCMKGRNRSGLVSALALVMLGFSGKEAIELVRLGRPQALGNSYFVAAVERLDRTPPASHVC